MSEEAVGRVVIIGNDLLAAALAVGLARHRIPPHVLVETVISRAKRARVPGLLIPSGPGKAQTELQRYQRWLADLAIPPVSVAFEVLPVALVAGDSPPLIASEIGVVDLTRLRVALRERLDQDAIPVEPACGAQPQWNGELVVGAARRTGLLSAREVVLASGLSPGRFWRLPRPAADLGRRALLRPRASGAGNRYMFPFDGSVWVSGDASPLTDEFPLPGGADALARRSRGIGVETSLRSFAVQRQAPGLLYTWANRGQGLLALPQVIRVMLLVLGALQLEGAPDDVDPI